MGGEWREAETVHCNKSVLPLLANLVLKEDCSRQRTFGNSHALVLQWLLRCLREHSSSNVLSMHTENVFVRCDGNDDN